MEYNRDIMKADIIENNAISNSNIRFTPPVIV